MLGSFFLCLVRSQACAVERYSPCSVGQIAQVWLAGLGFCRVFLSKAVPWTKGIAKTNLAFFDSNVSFDWRISVIEFGLLKWAGIR